jgi:hypothetical protein
LPKFGVDGDFGSETLIAVKQFQGLNGLPVDGVCGPITWEALLKEPEAELTIEYTVTICDCSLSEANEIKAKYPRAALTEEQE